MSLPPLHAGPNLPDSGIETVDLERRHRRLSLRCPRQLTSDAGAWRTVQARNISPGRPQIVCGKAIAARLREQSFNASCHYPAVLQAGVVLPLAQGLRRLTVGLGLNYRVTAEDDEDCLPGFSLVAWRPVARRRLASVPATKGAALAAASADQASRSGMSALRSCAI
jgi:hypothetical protein